MTHLMLRGLPLVAASLLGTLALAQTPAGSQTPAGPQTPASSQPTEGAQTPPTPPRGAAARGALEEAGEPRARTSAATEAATAATPTSAAPPAPPGRREARPGGKPAADRLDLGTATVTGDREQPKVMYVVPWKRADIGDLAARPMNSLLDEALAPVDRDEFRREVQYFRAVNGEAAQQGGSRAAAQGEK